MPQGNFARGLLPFMPAIAETAAEAMRRKDEQARAARLAAAFTPPTAEPGQVMGETNFGQFPGPQLEIPQATRERQGLAEQVRQPGTINDMLQSGYHPGDVLQILRALPQDAQSDFQEIYNNEKVKYLAHGPDSVDPFMKTLIEKEQNQVDPTSIGSVEEARIRAAQGLLPQAALQGIEGSQPVEPPDPIKNIEDALGRTHLDPKDPRYISREQFTAYQQDWDALEANRERIKVGSKPPEPEKPEFSRGDALKAVRERSRDARDYLAKEENRKQVITEDDYDNLSDSEKATFVKSDAGDTYEREDPAKRQQLDSLNVFLSDDAAQKQAADAWLGTMQPPTKAQMAAQLQAAGYTDATEDNPRLEEAYRNWKADQQ
jgi:hypothetical protein